LHLRGNCRLTQDDEDGWRFSAVADQVQLGGDDYPLLLTGDSGGARLTYGEGDKATVIEASSIRFDVRTRQVQTTDAACVQLGK
jgi:hypothetical protein